MADGDGTRDATGDDSSKEPVEVTELEKRAANYTPLTPLNFLRRAALAYPQHAAIIHGDLRYDYRTFYERSVRLASGLDGLGVGPGDTVAMLAPNIPAALEALFA